jgi:hypothetical protein
MLFKEMDVENLQRPLSKVEGGTQSRLPCAVRSLRA